MKVLLVGVGGVGEAIVKIAQSKPWVQQVVLADNSLERAREVQLKLGEPDRFPVEALDASDQKQIEALARKVKPDLIMNACVPSFNEQIFDAAFETGINYMDMAMTLAVPHPEKPYQLANIKLGDYQFERHERWEKKGLLAVLGLGVDPGMSDLFARYAQDHLFDEIDEIGVRDGSNIEIAGYEFAPGFSIWTTIDECLNPPMVWEKEKGWFTTEPFSEPAIKLPCVFKSRPSWVRSPPWQPMQRLSKIGMTSFAKLTVAPSAAGCVAAAGSVAVGADVSVAAGGSVSASVAVAGTAVSLGWEVGVSVA